VHTADYAYTGRGGEEGDEDEGEGEGELRTGRPPLSTSGTLWERRKASYAMQQAAAEARRKLSGRCRDALLGWRWDGTGRHGCWLGAAAGWALLLAGRCCWLGAAAGLPGLLGRGHLGRAALQSQEQPRRSRLDSRIPARARQRGLVAGLIPLRMHMLAINVGRRRIASSSALWRPLWRPLVSSHPPSVLFEAAQTIPRRRRWTRGIQTPNCLPSACTPPAAQQHCATGAGRHNCRRPQEAPCSAHERWGLSTVSSGANG
jgi:hypothetical protein